MSYFDTVKQFFRAKSKIWFRLFGTHQEVSTFKYFDVFQK